MSLHGAIAAAVTPLRDGGRALDEEAFDPLVRFLADGGADGLLALGTTGEGVLLTQAERRRAAERFVAARPRGFQVAVHCGAQTTHETISLSAHALGIGADAVAAIAPPYYPLDPDELFLHLRSAASACAPLPFYVYEFLGRSGYAIPVPVIERLHADAPNLRGLKVSDSPWTAVAPYLLDGLDLFVGLEPLVLQGLEAGATGAVSGLATAFPETVARLVHDRDGDAHQRVMALRDALAGIPFIAAMKAALAERDVPVREDVRAPLRGLTEQERSVVAGLT
ncbi:MAG: dihydrodipicolinate synthase family protein [Actinobacteria bacterium]|nr:dihydrodipicolinate synthase family protein [Actinomycetota bacterium]